MAMEYYKAQHDDEIRSMGNCIIEEFIEDVTTNYYNVKEGHKIYGKQSYLLEIKD